MCDIAGLMDARHAFYFLVEMIQHKRDSSLATISILEGMTLRSTISILEGILRATFSIEEATLG